MKKYSAIQPKDGDVVMSCGHDSHKYWAYFYPKPRKFVRPNWTAGESSFLVCCDNCSKKYDATGITPPVREDYIWKGDEPEFIEETA